jgi:hypothetical protein
MLAILSELLHGDKSFSLAIRSFTSMLVVATMAAMASAQGASGHKTFESKLQDEAVEIAILQDQGYSFCKVDINDAFGTASRSVQDTFVKLLESEKIAVKLSNNRDDIVINGSLFCGNLDDTKSGVKNPGISLEFTFKKNNEEVAELRSRKILHFPNGGEPLNELLQLIQQNITLIDKKGTFPTNPDDPMSTPGHLKTVKEQIDNPRKPYVVGGTRLYSGPDSNFSIEVLVKESGGAFKSRQISVPQNLMPQIDLRLGEEFVVKVYNETNDYDAAAQLELDGISFAAFSEINSWKERKSWIVPRLSETSKKGPMPIPGFLIDKKTLRPFRVDSAENSSVEGLPPALEHGTIAVRIFAAWKEDEPEPQINKLISSAGGERIVPGPVISHNTVTAPRNLGSVPLDNIVVRYTTPQDVP